MQVKGCVCGSTADSFLHAVMFGPQTAQDEEHAYLQTVLVPVLELGSLIHLQSRHPCFGLGTGLGSD